MSGAETVDLDEVELLQLVGQIPGGVEGEESDEEGEEGEDGDVEAALFRDPGHVVCEGAVLPGSRFKVVRTRPRGVLGRYVHGKTAARIMCPFSENGSEGVRELERVLLVPWPGATPRTESDCLAALKDWTRRVGRAHLAAGQGVPAFGPQDWLLVEACEPAAGLLGPGTSIHFARLDEPPATLEQARLRLVAESAGEHSVPTLQEALEAHLAARVPLMLQTGTSVFVPVARTQIMVSSHNPLYGRGGGRQPRRSLAEVRAARLSYFERQRGSSSVHEADMIEWRVVGPGAGVLAAETEVVICDRDDEDEHVAEDEQQLEYMDGPITEAAQAEGADRCLRCRALVRAPAPAGVVTLLGLVPRTTMLYRCPCGQPLANGAHPMWRSVERASRDVQSASRPSVSFLQELREVITLLPASDPRTHVLHSALRVLPLRPATGELDFDAADQLVLTIMPSLGTAAEGAARGVDAQVLGRLPVSVFADMHSLAEKRGDLSCCICMEPYAEDAEVRTLQCFHFFHRECVDRWLSMSSSCPICKFEVSV